MKTCKNCKEKTISIFQAALLGFGVSIKCKKCGSKLKTHILAQTINSIFLTILTVALLVILGNRFGFIGFVLAFIIPVFVDIVIGLFLPVEIIKKGMDIKERS